jgi:hypothetical protein
VLGFQFNVTQWCEVATPEPDSAIFNGEFGALLKTDKAPVALPALLGLKQSCRLTFCPGATVICPAPFALKPAPDTDILEIFASTLPWFVRVTSCDARLPTVTFGKLRLVVLADSFIEAATPVAVAVIVTGARSALSDTDTVPFTTPADVGVKLTVKFTLAPALTVTGRVIPEVLIPAPETATFVTVTLDLLLFARRTVWELLVPTGTFPNDNDDGVTVMA